MKLRLRRCTCITAQVSNHNNATQPLHISPVTLLMLQVQLDGSVGSFVAIMYHCEEGDGSGWCRLGGLVTRSKRAWRGCAPISTRRTVDEKCCTLKFNMLTSTMSSYEGQLRVAAWTLPANPNPNRRRRRSMGVFDLALEAKNIL